MIIADLSSYTEVIGLIYSQPTFIFTEYGSFLAFVASIRPTSFHAVRSVCITQTHEPYYNREYPSYPCRASYRLLQHLDVTVRNTDLPSLQSPGQRWQDVVVHPMHHSLRLMAGMQNLQAFRMDFDAKPGCLSSWLGSSCHNLEIKIINFARCRDFRDEFEVTVDSLDDVQNPPRLLGLRGLGLLRERKTGWI
jgi:hypothetical protein